MPPRREEASISELGLRSGGSIGGVILGAGSEGPCAPYEGFSEVEKKMRELRSDIDEKGACRGLDPAIFRAAINSDLGKKAVKVCNEECSVRQECLDYSYMIGDNEFGIRAGLSARQRRALFSRLRRQGEAPLRLDPIITRGKSS